MNSDQQLLAEYLDNESQSAFASLVERYLGLVWATATRVNQSTVASDDIAQQTFLLLAQKAHRLRHHAHLGLWLHRTSYLLALNERRRQQRSQRRQQDQAELMTTWNDSDGASEWSEIVPHLDKMLQRLRDHERQLILMRYFENLNWSEIATLLCMSEGAAKMALRRALDRLRGHLNRSGIATSMVVLSACLESLAATCPEPTHLSNLSNRIVEQLDTRIAGRYTSVIARPIPLAIMGVIVATVGLLVWKTNRNEAKLEASATIANPPRPETTASRSIADRLWHSFSTERLRHLEDLLRAALHDRKLPLDQALEEVKRVLDQFAPSSEHAVPILIDALQQSLEPGTFSQKVEDYYFFGKEHFLALHAIQYLGPRAKNALPFLLKQLKGTAIPSHSKYPATIRATQPPPSIVPQLLEALSSRFFIVNAMGQELAELVGELALKDPIQHDLAQRQLQSLLNEAHPTLRTTAAYALSFLVEQASDLHLEILTDAVSDNWTTTLGLLPQIEDSQSFVHAVMRTTAASGDVEGRRTLGILGLGNLGSQAATLVEPLKQIALLHTSRNTRQNAIDAISRINPELAESDPVLRNERTKQRSLAELQDHLLDETMEDHHLLPALKISETRVAALNHSRFTVDFSSRFAAELLKTLETGKGDGLTPLARHIAQRDPRDLVSVLKTRNTQAIRATAQALGERGPEAAWALPHLVAVRSWLPYKSPDLEQAIKRISQAQTEPVNVYNILPDAVAIYLKAQAAQDIEQQRSVWDLLFQYGPNLSWLPRPGIEKLAHEMANIKPDYAKMIRAALARELSMNGSSD